MSTPWIIFDKFLHLTRVRFLVNYPFSYSYTLRGDVNIDGYDTVHGMAMGEGKKWHRKE